MNKPNVQWLNNPFDLTDITHYSLDKSLTIRQWLDGHGGVSRLNRMPTVCVYKNRELLRSEYDQLIEEPVYFVTLPAGGDSGTNPIAAILIIALTVYTGGLAAGGFGGAMTAGGFAAGMSAGVIVVAGSALINAVFPPPGQPSNNSPSTGSSTYTAGAQGNQARLGQPIPVNYGKMRIYPDFAARPYSEYESNEQYLYQLFCIGQGLNDISNIRLDNTPIANFDDATVELVKPHEKVTLFHTAVVQAPEAGGQDLSEPITFGPYVINNVDTEISRVACDVVFPAGLIRIKDDGEEKSTSVHLNVWADPIDDEGNIIGGREVIFDEEISRKTRTAIRLTLAKDVPPGRYQMSIERTTAKPGSQYIKNCSLGAMKGYLVDNNEYGDVTLLALRIRATANLSDAASRLVNGINERLIPVWNPDNGWTVEPVKTRSPAWAFADAIRARYGGDFPDSEIDLYGLHYLAGLFDSRGDTFDGRFDTENNLWDALGRIGQVCRSGPIRQGNLYRLIRDQHQETPVQVFGMSNMRDFSIDYVMHDEHTADSVKVTYWDEARDYAETTITAQLPDDPADNPKEIVLFGCTNYEQAWREGMYLAASNRERRQLVSWTTEMEGHIPTFGDLVWVNHDLLGAGRQFGGTVAAVNGAVLTLSRDVALEGESWYILIRDRYGGPSPPIPIEPVDSHRVRLLDTLPEIETDPIREPSHFMIGQGSEYAFPVKITSLSPEADDRVALAGCIESEFVHTADEGEIPAPPPDFKPPPPGLDIDDLRATQGGTHESPTIYLSWAFASGADHYRIEYQPPESDLWQPAGAGLSLINSHEFTSEPGDITCRVAAVAAVRGEWATIPVNAGGDFDTPGPVEIELSEPFVGEAMKVHWEHEPSAARYLLEVWSKDQYRRGFYLERDITTYEYHWQDAQKDVAGRAITVQVRAVNAENVAGEWGSVTATNPPPDAPVNVSAVGLFNSIRIRCDHNYDPDILELRVYGSQDNTFEPEPDNLLAAEHASLLSFPVETGSVWFMRLAWVDLWGSADLNFSGIIEAEVGPITETEIGPDSISTPMLKANSVIAEKIEADAITGREISSETTLTAGSGNKTAGMNGSDKAGEPLNGIRFWSGADADHAEQADFRVNDEGTLFARNGIFTGGKIEAGEIEGGEITGAVIESGIMNGTEISGSVIDGSYFIGQQELLVPTEADKGPGTTRYLTLLSPFTVEDSANVSYPRVDRPNNSSHSQQSTLTFDIVSAAYDNGLNDVVAENFYRYKFFLISPAIQLSTDSNMYSYDWDYGDSNNSESAYLAGPTLMEFTVNAINASQSRFTLNVNSFNLGDNSVGITIGNVRIHGTVNVIDRGFKVFKVFNTFRLNFSLVDYRYDNNSICRFRIQFRVVRNYNSYGGWFTPYTPAFDVSMTANDVSHDDVSQLLDESDKEVLKALEDKYLADTELHKKREQWRKRLANKD